MPTPAMPMNSLLDTQTTSLQELVRAAYYSIFGSSMQVFGRSASLCYSVGSFLGHVRYRAGYVGKDRSRKAYLKLLSTALPHLSDKQLRKVLKQFWINHQKMLLELFLFKHLPDYYLGERVQISGLKYLDEAVQRGRGVILATPHFGNERVIHLALGYRNYDVAVVTSPFYGAHARVKDAKLGAAYKWNFVRFPNQNPRWLYRFLQNRGIIQLSPTGPGTVNDPWTRFLNHQVKVSTAPSRISLKTGAVLLPVLDYRLKDNSHRIEFFPPLERPSGAGPRDTWLAHSKSLLEFFEQSICSDPGQFYWMWLAIRSQE